MVQFFASQCIYGSEMWLMKVRHEVELDRTEMSMIWWFTLKEAQEVKSSELLELETVSFMISKDRLRWFGDVM